MLCYVMIQTHLGLPWRMNYSAVPFTVRLS